MNITNYLISKAIKNGGLTFRNKKQKVKSGFMVSQKDTEKIVKVNDIAQLKREIQDYVNNNKLGKGQYYGLWFDNGNCYIDISKRISIKSLALDYAKQEQQLAIFDNANMKVITL
jgi:septum formation inhibitor-activating ATPase MinD